MQDAASFRKAARTLAAQHVPAGGGRLVILPVQWRKSLDVKAERVLDTITPDAPSLRPIRQVLNGTHAPRPSLRGSRAPGRHAARRRVRCRRELRRGLLFSLSVHL
jgi:hypothetical protein